jgi:hypothetical protein
MNTTTASGRPRRTFALRRRRADVGRVERIRGDRRDRRVALRRHRREAAALVELLVGREERGQVVGRGRERQPVGDPARRPEAGQPVAVEAVHEAVVGHQKRK